MLEGKVALVTGAGSGIGRELSLALASRGALVHATDLDPHAAQETAARCAEPCRSSALDVGDIGQISSTVEQIVTGHGRLDLLVNNAGIGAAGELLHSTAQTWHEVIRTNLMGTVHGCLAAYPQMVRQGHGHIVNIASLYGLVGSPMLSAYAASKHGVVGLSTSLYHEARRHGVHVTVVCPGYVTTPMFDRARYEGTSKQEAMALLPFPMMAVDHAVRRIVRGIERRRRLVAFPLYVRAYVTLNRHLPGFVARVTQRILQRLDHEGPRGTCGGTGGNR